MSKENTDNALKTTIIGTGATTGAAGGYSVSAVAATVAAGHGSTSTVLGTLAAKGLIGKGAVAVLAAHPAGLAALGAGAGIYGAYLLCRKLYDDQR